MSVLIPLYLAGLTALSLPLLFHLVRRTPRGRQVFSSLMFLAPTIPKLTKRSRLDQILLLLLRLAALALIVLAFSRPFLREASLLSMADLTGRRVAILLDTSGSMRGGDLWTQAIQQAEKELGELNPQDDVALFAFSNRLETLIDFAKTDSAPIADKPQVVRNRLKELEPGWGTTDLGTALVSVAAELDAATDVRQSALEPRIVVISDFQASSKLDAIRAYEWPERIPVIAHHLTLTKPTNACAHILPNVEGDELTEVRVRVINAENSKSDQFHLSWQGDRINAKPKEVDVYVPAGQSRVLKLPRGVDELTADRIVLRGDDQPFDNTFYVVPPRKQAVTVLYVGTETPAAKPDLPVEQKTDSPQSQQYFFRLAVANDPLRQVEVRSVDESQKLLVAPAEPAPGLVVVSRQVPPELQTSLTGYVERGGLLLLIPDSDEAAKQLTSFNDELEWQPASTAPAPLAATGADKEKYLLFGDIDFTHPLFAPFASPPYNDFTRIHFWKHFAVQPKGEQSRVLARFDNGDPVLIERTLDKGRVIVLTSGWQPSHSQFALSSKFVPFIGSLLDLAAGGIEPTASVVIDDPVPLPVSTNSTATTVRTPDGKESKLASDATRFTGTSQPGIYLAKTSPLETRFAVNLSPIESNTAPLSLEQLEQAGVRLGDQQTRSERVAAVRQQRDTELEGRQKIWRWLIVVAIGTLIIESLLAGRADNQIRAATNEPAT